MKKSRKASAPGAFGKWLSNGLCLHSVICQELDKMQNVITTKLPTVCSTTA